MALFRRAPRPTTHRVEIRFAQPMTPRTRHGHEDGLSTQLLPQLGATVAVVGGGTALTSTGEPEASDVVLDVTTDDVDGVLTALVATLESNGIGRGSWLAVDGVRRSVGVTEHVLLRTRVGDAPLQDPAGTSAALQAALGDGRIGYHDETYLGVDGPVYVFSGDDAGSIVAALRAELPRHPQLAAGVVVVHGAGPRQDG